MTAKRQSKIAFTLVEVLFASVLMVVLSAIVLYLSNNVIDSWKGATNDFAMDMEADIALDYLARDLSSAFFRDDGKTWLISDQGATSNRPRQHPLAAVFHFRQRPGPQPPR